MESRKMTVTAFTDASGNYVGCPDGFDPSATVDTIPVVELGNFEVDDNNRASGTYISKGSVVHVRGFVNRG